ncbi:hypothetical protein ACFY40_15135 [Streptomyces sp. NPDC012950]|uniref:hypothetical protein n=1 Tax=Streptomyces sp. NPDC012950 TaxID=3364858 RepID=UPI003688BEE5
MYWRSSATYEDQVLCPSVPVPCFHHSISRWSREYPPSSERPSCGVSGAIPAASSTVGAMSMFATIRSSVVPPPGPPPGQERWNGTSWAGR